MIESLAHEIADQMRIPLTHVELVDGMRLGCRDAHLLKLTASDKTVSTLIHLEDASEFQNEIDSARAEQNIHRAITKLKSMLGHD